MSSVAKRPDGRWRARYRDEAGQEHARHFTRKIDAERWVATQTADLARGEWIDPRQGRMTFEQYATEWAKAQVWRPKTASRVESTLRLHLLPALGTRPISAVRATEVQAFVRGLSAHMEPSSVRTVYTVLRGVFRAATLDRVITSSPCVRITLPTAAPKGLLIPEAVTVHALADALPPHLRAVVYVAAGLGLRPGECFGLDLADVDFLRRSVRVARQLDAARKLTPLKTPSSYRTVPLPQAVADELAQHLASSGLTPGGGGLIFRASDGQPVTRNSFERMWRNAAGTVGAIGLRLHDLRHAYASALIVAGESVKVVQQRMGHASAMVTLDVYGHLWPDSDDKTRSAVDAFLGAGADSLRTAETKAQVSGADPRFLK